MSATVLHRPKRLLVLGASLMRAAAFGVWRQMGLQIVLVDGYSPARYEDLAHEFFALDPRDGSADLDEIRKLGTGCDGVTTVSDDSQCTVAAIAEELGLPGIPARAAAVARSKALQRVVCGRSGVPVPRWREVHSADDVRDFYTDGPTPAVLKPTDGAGGVGALRVETVNDAVRHWPVVRSLSPARAAVIEEYVEGREVCVDAIIADGCPVFVALADCEHMATIGFLCTAARYDARQPDRDAATEMIRRVASAMNITQGTMHAEFKIKGGRWVLIEVGMRPGGAFVPELTVRITGLDIYEAQARLALGEDPLRSETTHGQPEAMYAQSRYLVGEGPVKTFVPPGKIIADLPDVKVVNQQLAAGQRARLPVSEVGRAGFAYGWGSDPERLDDQLREAISRLGREMGLVVHGNDHDSALAA